MVNELVREREVRWWWVNGYLHGCMIPMHANGEWVAGKEMGMESVMEDASLVMF